MSDTASRDPSASWDEDDRVILDHAIERELGRMLHVPPGTRWRDLGGSWTTNVRVDIKGSPPRVARIHQRTTSYDRLRAEQAVRRELVAAGIPAVAPIPFPDGELIARLGAGQLVEVERAVEWDARMDAVDRLVDGFGLLARVHRVLGGLDIPAARTVRFANHIDRGDALANCIEGADRIRSWNEPHLTAFVDRFLAFLRDVLHRESVEAGDDPDQTPRQLVHGDWWDNNVLFREGRIVAVLDVGFMAERPRLDDLALPLWFFLLRDGADPDTDPGSVSAMVDAYDASSDLALTRTERRMLPLVIARQLAWSIGRWVPYLDEADARKHTRSAAAEFPRAEAVLADLDRWHDSLGVGS